MKTILFLFLLHVAVPAFAVKPRLHASEARQLVRCTKQETPELDAEIEKGARAGHRYMVVQRALQECETFSLKERGFDVRSGEHWDISAKKYRPRTEIVWGAE